MIPSLSLLEVVLRRHDLTWPQLQDASMAVFLFGSRAAGCEREDSDWDLLCIGDGRSRMRQGLDLIWIPVHRAEDVRWRETELASHVAAWGRCLHGDEHWIRDARPGSRAVRLKTQVLEGRVRALPQGRAWPSERQRRRRSEEIRRDLQRYASLTDGVAVPPTAQLDHRWQHESERERVALVARDAGWTTLVPFIQAVDAGAIRPQPGA